LKKVQALMKAPMKARKKIAGLSCFGIGFRLTKWKAVDQSPGASNRSMPDNSIDETDYFSDSEEHHGLS